jgi:hypothetical protein
LVSLNKSWPVTTSLSFGRHWKIGTEDPVVATAADLTVGEQRADERLTHVVAHPADADEGLKVLRAEIGAVGSRNDDESPALVVHGERRVRGRAHLAGGARAHRGGRDRAGVHGGDRSRQQIDAFEEERRFSGKNSANRSLAVICATSASTWEKSGVHGEIERGDGGLGSISRRARLGVGGRRGQRASQPGARRAFAARDAIRGRHPGSARREILESVEVLLVTDEAAAVARLLGGEHLIAAIARPVAVEHDPPGLRVSARVAQRRERNANLERPTAAVDLAGRIPEPIGSVVLAAVGIGVHRVVLDAARIGEEQDRRLAVVLGVEHEPAVIRRAFDVVAIGIGSADGGRIGVGEIECGVEILVVVGEPRDIRDLRGDACRRDWSRTRRRWDRHRATRHRRCRRPPRSDPWLDGC